VLPELGDGMNLCGITFCPDSNRFYLALNDSGRIASFPASGPEDGVRLEQFELQRFFTDDMVWGIAWDESAPGFRVTHVSPSGPGCVLALYNPDGTFAGDTWDIGAIEPGAWFAGLDADPSGALWATEVGIHNRMYCLDPAAKRAVAFLPGPTASYRACSFLGDSSCFLVSGGWNDHNLVRLSRTGAVAQSVPLPDLADLDVYQPATPRPESLVWAYATRSDQDNTIDQVCLGRTWSGVGIREAAAAPAREPGLTAAPNPVRGRLVRINCPRVPGNLSLFDATGRHVLTRAVSGPVRLGLADGQNRSLPSGVYLLRLSAGGSSRTLKLVLLPDHGRSQE
jgi:hypothetical protein